MADVPQDFGRRILHAARLAVAAHLQQAAAARSAGGPLGGQNVTIGGTDPAAAAQAGPRGSGRGNRQTNAPSHPAMDRGRSGMIYGLLGHRRADQFLPPGRDRQQPR